MSIDVQIPVTLVDYLSQCKTYSGIGWFESVAKLIFEFENYRAFKDRQRIDLSEKFTFVTGRNNSGKSNVLRIVALVTKQTFTNESYVPDRVIHTKSDSPIGTLIYFPLENEETLLQQLGEQDRKKFKNIGFIKYFNAKENNRFAFNEQISSKLMIDNLSEATINYIARSFSVHTSRNADDRVKKIINSSNPQSFIDKGSVYVSSIRFMTIPGQKIQHFNEFPINSEIISPETMVATLKKLDRPSSKEDGETAKRQLVNVEKFAQYCLECNSIKIEVAHDTTSVTVVVDGESRTLNELGTGIEQLLFIGTGSAAFPGKIVLLEEPELHFHPRAIRRMIEYLDENMDNKFVISTHSAAVLDSVPGIVHHVTRTGDESKIEIVESTKERHGVVRDLGYRPSDIIQSNFIIWVEGPTDRLYINEWLRLAGSNLDEGIDYTIIFYGGAVLANHSFDDKGTFDDFVNALSLNPNLAVVMDRDNATPHAPLTPSKIRVRNELKKVGGFEWVTQGREIENYLPKPVLLAAKEKYPKIKAKGGKYDKIIPPKSVSKVIFAKWVIEYGLSLDVFDLKEKVRKLINAIEAVRN